MNMIKEKVQTYFSKTKKITLVFVLTLLFLNTVYAGQIKHTVIGPYGNIIAENSKSYGTEKATTIIEDRYKDFEYNLITSSFTTEPYCKFGGQYNIRVYNNPIYAGVYDRTMKLYYCKTTQDLINHMKIPNSWQNDDLVLYCNDGSNIYNPDFNLDFLTSKVNTYKMCVLKNLNKSSDNTLIFGYDAGNKLIDSSATNRFNTNTKTGPIVANLNRNSSESDTLGSTLITKRIFFYVPYVNVCKTAQLTCPNILSYGGDMGDVCLSEYVWQCIEWVDVPRQASYGHYVSPPEASALNNGVQTLSNYVQTNICNSNQLNCNMTTLTTYKNYASHTYTSIVININMSQDTYLYELDGRTYSFFYEPYNHFYVLRELSGEPLNLSLNKVFNKDIGISRIALFRKSGSNKIYGYETAMQNQITGTTSIKPIYKIQNISGLGFNQDVCMNALAIYNPQTSLSTTSKIACMPNGDIYLNSQALDGDNPLSEEGYSLNLFKNIILGIE